VAHAGESLLSLLRDGAIGLTPERTTALLSLVDAVRQMLGSIETSGNEGERNDAELVETLKRLQKDDDKNGETVEAPQEAKKSWKKRGRKKLTQRALRRVRRRRGRRSSWARFWWRWGR